MPTLRLGIRLACLRLEPREAIHTAGRLGVQAVQLDPVGPLAPENLSGTGRRDLAHLLGRYGLAVSGLAAESLPLGEPNTWDPALAQLARLFELSRYLGSGIVTVAAGRIPESPDSPLWAAMRAGLNEVQRLAGHYGGVLALATGPDKPEDLQRLLAPFDPASVGVNLSPAGLLAAGFDPVPATLLLGPRLVHTQVRDISRRGVLARAQETALGEGQVDWPAWLAALEAVDYRGVLTLETRTADDPLGYLTAGLRFLRSL